VTCTGAGGARIALAGRSLPPPELQLRVEYAGGLQALRLGGHVTADVAADVALPEGFVGEVECRADPETVDLPWPGALLLGLPSRLTYGPSLALSAEASGPVHAAPEVVLDATIDAGLQRDGGTARFGGRYGVTADAALGPSPATAAYRLEANVGVTAELSMGPSWAWTPDPVLGVRVGQVAAATWSPPAAQASAPAIRSRWSRDTSASAWPSEDPEAALERLAVAGSFTSFLVDLASTGPLWASATGVLAASPGRFVPGGSLELTATLDPLVAPAGQTPVSRIEVFRRAGGALLPVCSVPTTAAGQRTYACAAEFPGVVSGDRIELHAFAVDPSAALPTEIAGAPLVVDVE
jgi:hypothetical protein